MYPPGPGTESESDEKEIGRHSQSVVEKGGICVGRSKMSEGRGRKERGDEGGLGGMQE